MQLDFKVLPVKGSNLFDVFQGEGWKNWTRVLVKPGCTAILAGNTLHQRILDRIFKK